MDATAAASTLIFVDIDGVLNTCVSDGGRAPLLLDEVNMRNADRIAEMARTNMRRPPHFEELQRYAHTMHSVAQRPLYHGEGASYSKFTAMGQSWVSELFVERLAKLITAAGCRRKVVLSSTWRRPKHAARLKQLEEQLGRYLGCAFTFEARTALCDEQTPADRLRCIGDFVAEHWRSLGNTSARLNVLVLEE
eukprot:TRINITY_DN13491_c0_g1_i1.p1 TRINITY_DN13491_c0_g1~~TRINITY_DN13491_c0_g1_i1.p1  ORF type:complete len:193 (-),score=36.21 TRINITY_DN13491_c0_g1_i1:334-912(-)